MKVDFLVGEYDDLRGCFLVKKAAVNYEQSGGSDIYEPTSIIQDIDPFAIAEEMSAECFYQTGQRKLSADRWIKLKRRIQNVK